MHQHDCICLPGLYAHITTFQYHCQFFPNSSGRAVPKGMVVASTVIKRTPQVPICTASGLPCRMMTDSPLRNVYMRPHMGQVYVTPSVDTQVWVSITPCLPRVRRG